MQEKLSERRWGRKWTQKNDGYMRFMQKSSIDLWGTYGGNSEDICSNTTDRAILDHGGIEAPTDPDRPYCIYLVGHSKKYHIFGKIKNHFPKIGVKFRLPRRGLRKYRLSLYSRRLSLYLPIFLKNSKFLGKLASRNCANALWVRLDRNISNNIYILIYKNIEYLNIYILI